MRAAFGPAQATPVKPYPLPVIIEAHRRCNIVVLFPDGRSLYAEWGGVAYEDRVSHATIFPPREEVLMEKWAFLGVEGVGSTDVMEVRPVTLEDCPRGWAASRAERNAFIWQEAWKKAKS